jgi:RimK family alpha-L-glutamate ligase
MKGMLVVNAYVKTPSQLSQARRIAEEFALLGIEVEVVKNINLATIKDGHIIAKKYDFCIFLDKDKSAARMLEKSGLRLFNCAEAIEVCDNKMLTHIALAENDIPMPDCVYAPLCYYPDANISEGYLKGVGNSLGFPLVAKKCYGSLGMAVYLITSQKELRQFEEENKLTEHFYQRFIDCGKGEDTRVIVVGGKVVCAMQRINENDFRSNIELGGHGQKIEISDDLKSLCERVAGLLHLDYCGIDVLTDREGRHYICEVNSNAFFAEAEKVCKTNIAKYYAIHIIDTLSK